MKKIARFLRQNGLILLLSLLAWQFGHQKNRWPELLFGYDAEGYYMYLPAVFIAGGFDKYDPASPDGYFPKRLDGQYFTKYTCGVALLQAPFFFAAKTLHTLQHGNPGDGRGVIYGRAVLLAAAFYAFLGLFFLQKILVRAGIRPGWRVLILVGLFWGTNWLFYATRAPGHSHVYSAFLMAVFCWLLPVFWGKPTWRNSFLMGLVLGWLVLIRPTNALVALVFLFYGISKWADFQSKWLLIKGNWQKIPAFALAAALPWIPQMIYWKQVTGRWLLDSYDEERFEFWKNPKIGMVLFDFQNGLFVYSPVLLLAVAALLFDWKRNVANSRAVLLTLAAATYLYASWWLWYFGGAFGHRCYVDWLPLLALPMGLFFQNNVAKWPRVARFSMVVAVLLMVYFTVGLTCIYEWPWERPAFSWAKLGEAIWSILPPWSVK